MKRKSSRVEYYSVDSVIKEAEEAYGHEVTCEELLEYIVGDRDNNYGYSYCLRRYNKPKRSFMKRVNLLWVAPLFVLCMPITYLITGDTGVKHNSRIGKLLDWLVGI